MTIVLGTGASRDEEPIWFNGALVTVRLGGADTHGEFNLIEVLAPGGHTTPLHADPNCESFYLLEGEMLFHIAGQERRAVAGDTVVLFTGVPHAFLVTSPLARYVLINSPGGQDAFFRAGGTPAAAGELPPPAPPDFARMAATAAQFGITILGPPPFAVRGAREATDA